ncbi:GntR family transcriptional regulator [Streptomyces sp. TRM76323]|uniref:GntR family transcriptional regulator n=1 Tax=Streptomyces tamarix TaxID=3078565 RepID=A0ABU3QMK1_9ACTN|nr:GntR family transcriptional regulator [Streptomyces tamarix]MDT9683999.1 GntR family transcriptional regulator [Streptomyces tamarix]
MAEPHASTALPLYLQVAAALRDDLAGGRFAPGARLPSERSLVHRFGVNRQTVRNALRLLRDEGLVVTERRGTYAAPAEPAAAGPGPVLASGLLEFPVAGSGPDRVVEAALGWEPAPGATAELLGLLPGEPTLVHRHRVLGPDGALEHGAVSRFSRYALAEVPELGRYRRAEARPGHRPDLRPAYRWMHRAGLRLTRRESIGVGLPGAAAYLTVHREVQDQHGHVLEVTDIRFAPRSAPLTYEFTA